MERISPLYGQDDSTLLIIDSEQTLLEDGRSGYGEETLYSPVADPLADSERTRVWEGGSNGGSSDVPRPNKERAGNPLLNAAQEVLVFGVEMSSLARDAQMHALRQQAVHQVKAFEARGQAWGLAKPIMLAARYVICTFLDEQVMTSPWGGAHEWTQESLLSQFHGETYGGQGFFNILQRACDEPQRNLHLLELLFTLLSLGFQGKYRVDSDGQRKLESLRDMIMALLQRTAGDRRHSLALGAEPPLSQQSVARPWLGRLLLLGAVACLGAMHVTLQLLLTQDTQQVTQRLEALEVPLVGNGTVLAISGPPSDARY